MIKLLLIIALLNTAFTVPLRPPEGTTAFNGTVTTKYGKWVGASIVDANKMLYVNKKANTFIVYGHNQDEFFGDVLLEFDEGSRFEIEVVGTTAKADATEGDGLYLFKKKYTYGGIETNITKEKK